MTMASQLTKPQVQHLMSLNIAAAEVEVCTPVVMLFFEQVDLSASADLFHVAGLHFALELL